MGLGPCCVELHILVSRASWGPEHEDQEALGTQNFRTSGHSNDLKSRTSNPVSPEPHGARAQAPRRLWGREWELHGGTVLTQFPTQPRESQ